MPRDGDGLDPAHVQSVLDDLAEEALADDEVWGIPSDEMPDADAHRFGLAVSLSDGTLLSSGEADVPFAIQSISKLFALTLALETSDDAEIWKRVGREPSGDPFDSLIDLEHHNGVPRNPFMNAGALVLVDMLLSQPDRSGHPDYVRVFLAKRIGVVPAALPVNADVLRSEHRDGATNRAMAYLAKAHDNLRNPVEEVMEVYVRQCAVELSCRQLAEAGRYLMRGRADELAGVSPAAARRSRRLNALMLTCGQYTGAGDFAFRVGMPAKSGVAGGILAVAPDVASVAVWAPGLDENGNSLLGTRALEHLSERMGWSVFGATEPK